MFNKKNTLEILKLGGILCAIAVVVSLILAVANFYTKDLISDALDKKTVESLKAVFPNAQNYEKATENVYIAKTDNIVVGYCAKTSSQGYAGEVSLMVGMDYNFNITKYTILQSNETPGLGTKASESEFYDQFKGKGPFKVKKDGGKIDAISGATITSRAVCDAINRAIEDCKKVGGITQ